MKPSRHDALSRLAAFVPRAGAEYARLRNFDLPLHPHVSGLSPALRHRLISEPEVLRAVLGRHSPQAAEKFIQEVFWRSYWKGWLELHPSVWHDYRTGLAGARNQLALQSGLRGGWQEACLGRTGIDCFDHWAHELVETGYLHNHARMWFASIWIFTLRLPWQLGADFFLRHLLDGDAASNTLSWRWVGGLQTQGKTYLARPDNIARYTQGRFAPSGLATVAPPLPPEAPPRRRTLPESKSLDLDLRSGLLLHDEDLTPGWLLRQVRPAAVATLSGAALRSPFEVAPGVAAFSQAALQDCAGRLAAGPVRSLTDPAELADWASREGLEQIVTPWCPTGPLAEALAAVALPLVQVMRPYDALVWPRATAGFFRFREAIPKFLSALGSEGFA